MKRATKGNMGGGEEEKPMQTGRRRESRTVSDNSKDKITSKRGTNELTLIYDMEIRTKSAQRT